FNQRFRDGTARHSYEWLLDALAQVMNCARNQLFSGAAFTGDEHKGVQVRYAPNQVINHLRASRGTNEAVTARSRTQLLPSLFQFPLQGGVLMGPPDYDLQLRQGRRLAQVIINATLQQFQHGGAPAVI